MQAFKLSEQEWSDSLGREDELEKTKTSNTFRSQVWLQKLFYYCIYLFGYYFLCLTRNAQEAAATTWFAIFYNSNGILF